MEQKDIYYKQKKLFDPTTFQPEIHVYGCGSIGSHTVLALAKTGFTNIHVYDYDIVEEGNIPTQLYGMKHVGMQKLEALQEIVETLTPAQIYTHEGKIDSNLQLIPKLNSIHILAFDNMDARQIIAERVKNFPVLLIDGRIGGYNYEIYSSFGNDDECYQQYMTTLTGTFSETLCGEKGLWAINSILASRVVERVLRWGKQEKQVFLEKGNLFSRISIHTGE